MLHPSTTAAPVVPGAPTPGGDRCNPSIQKNEQENIIMARINDAFDCHGHHTMWCSGQDDPHDADSPYCEHMLGGVEGVTEPNWIRTQVWVTTIAPFTHGTFTRREYAAVERNRKGVQLSHQSDLGTGWTPETLINLTSGEARTLAALLVAAADISDGITRFDRENK